MWLVVKRVLVLAEDCLWLKLLMVLIRLDQVLVDLEPIIVAYGLHVLDLQARVCLVGHMLNLVVRQLLL